MSLLRAIRDDFVEQRLWPIAVALAVALVAVPVALGRGGGAEEPTPATPPAAAAPPGPVAASDAVRLITTPRRGAARGPAADPFVPRASGASVKAAPTAAPSAGGAPASPVTSVSGGQVSITRSLGSGASSAPSGPSGSAPAASAPRAAAPSRPAATSPAPAAAGSAAGLRVDLRFGELGDMDLRTDVTRLAPLNATAGVVAVFLGVLSDRRTAVFVVADEAKISGAGRCLPTAQACRVVELRAGEKVRFTLPAGSYELQLARVAARRAPTAARAASALRRESRAGRRVLRGLIAGGELYVGRYAYSRASGALARQAP